MFYDFFRRWQSLMNLASNTNLFQSVHHGNFQNLNRVNFTQ